MRRENVTKVGDGKSFLEVGMLDRLPSVANQAKSPLVSRNYNLFNSLHVVDTLAKENWFPVLAQEQRVRNEDRKGYQKHLIRFRQPGSALKNVGDVAPELTVTNAHDTSAAWIFMGGAYKLACANGLIVCQSLLASVRVRHMGFDEAHVLGVAANLSKQIHLIVDKIREYQNIELSVLERIAFAEEAIGLKFRTDEVEMRENGIAVTGDRAFSVTALLEPRRTEDSRPTLWNVFNTVQEKFIKGNAYERTVRMIGGRVHNTTKVRGIEAIDENIRINTGLWELMDLFSQLKKS